METNSKETTTNVVIPDNIEELILAYFSREAEKMPPHTYPICHLSDGKIVFIAANSLGHGHDFHSAYNLPEAISGFIEKRKSGKAARIAMLRRELAEAEAEEESQPIAMPEEVAAS